MNILTLIAACVGQFSPINPAPYNPYDISGAVMGSLSIICNDTTCFFGTGTVGTPTASENIGGHAVAADHGTAIGQASNAGVNGASFGQNAVSSGATSIAIGQGTLASGVSSSAVGQSAVSSGVDSVAVGRGAIANSDAATALGNSANAGAVNATAIGKSSVATNTNATAVGEASVANDIGSTALGAVTTATGNTATALGAQANASGLASLAAGYISSATGSISTAVGGGAIASAQDASAFGHEATATGTDSTALGHAANASVLNAVAVGHSASATNTSSTAVGSTSTASNNGSVAVGYNARATGAQTTAVGTFPLISGAWGTGIGYSAGAAGANATSVGGAAAAQADNATAIGMSATIAAGATNSTAIGYAALANTGSEITVVGANSSATGIGSTSLGAGNASTYAHTLQLGAPSATAPAKTNQAIIGSLTNPLILRAVGSALRLDNTSIRFFTGAPMTSDAVPYNLYLQGTNAYEKATVNTKGGDLIVQGGIGTRQVVVNNFANSEGDTVTVAGGSSMTFTARNPGPAGANEWLCITSDVVCATNLAVLITANHPYYSAANNVTTTVALTPYTDVNGFINPGGSISIVDAGGGGAFGTAVNGSRGQVLYLLSAASAPSISILGDSDTGIDSPAANTVGIVGGGVEAIKIDNTGMDISIIKQADLVVGSCTLGQLRYDTGGATAEMCYCQALNNWMCWTVVPGPVD